MPIHFPYRTLHALADAQANFEWLESHWASATSASPDATTTGKGIIQLSGDLTGTAASPQIASGVITDADVSPGNKDGTAATPSLRTLGTGAQQAAAGNDARFGATGTAGGDLSGTYPNPTVVKAAGNLAVTSVLSAGLGLRVKEGANLKQGVATLVAGTVVVANTSVTATSRIFLTAQDNSSTGALRVSARTAGTSFTITSSNAADTGVVAYQIFEPG